MHIQRVIEVSKRYFPQTAVGFSSPKVKVHIQDGAEFMQQCVGQFDVIITDSSDPIGEDSSIHHLGVITCKEDLSYLYTYRAGDCLFCSCTANIFTALHFSLFLPHNIKYTIEARCSHSSKKVVTVAYSVAVLQNMFLANSAKTMHRVLHEIVVLFRNRKHSTKVVCNI